MTSTTIPARPGRVTPRAALGIAVAALGTTAVAALAVVTFTGVADGSPARPAPATTSDARQMPTPEWLERYLDPQAASGVGEPARPYPGRPVNAGLR